MLAQPPDLSQKLPRLEPRRRHSSQSNTNPPPTTPPLPPPPDLTSWTYRLPSRRILTPADHRLFQSSPTHTLLLSFVFTLSDRVRDTPVSALTPTELAHPLIDLLLAVLSDAESLISAHPPVDAGGSRFGNPAFRDFLAGAAAQQARWHAALGVPEGAARDELAAYLQGSLGSGERVDYGSGHELHFAVWLLGLNRVGLLGAGLFRAAALRVFPRYLRLVRALQTAYYLEPAGSHGVWGLDDYQFLPFLWGASQLVGHPVLRPRSVHSRLQVEEGSADYLYLDQVRFVGSVKTVEGLRWHSPMLDDVSAAKSWAKIEAGMRRMFIAEVLGKLPVMQHFLFGSLVPAAEGMSEEAEVEGGVGHDHQHSGESWDDCCGIKVPSSVGAVGEMRKRMGMEGLRRIPFD